MGYKKKSTSAFARRLLSHWWGMLARARTAKRLSRDGRERLLASSYVLLQSKLAPEEIMPATVRNILGDELHDLLYGEARIEGGVATIKNERINVDELYRRTNRGLARA